MQQFKNLDTYRCVEEGHIIPEKTTCHSREGSIMQVGAGMGWMSHTATKERSLRKWLCIMAAVVQKHLDTGT